ncbi:MAG: class I mannose-6-phosphate isomerase [Pseudomonadota bacterium]
MKPYKTKPLLVERLWGGNRLQDYNKETCGLTMGESWETGDISSGSPILIKLIHAGESLSVQVHPDDAYAARVENAASGKEEAWIVLEAEEPAFIIYGFNRPLKQEELRSYVDAGNITEVLRIVKVKKGDVVYIPAGTVHSLGKGLVVYEVQQPSDLTYRLFDWNRTDTSGKPRELHIEKALEAINYTGELPVIRNIYDSPRDDTLGIFDCGGFRLIAEALDYKERHYICGGGFSAVTVISGSIRLCFDDSAILTYKGDTCIIPEEYDGIVALEGLGASEYIVATNKI